MKKFIERFIGYTWGPYSDFLRNPTKYGGRQKSHIDCQWTTPEHFAHNNYSRGHLPQMYITASGWKAKLLALLFWPDPPYKSTNEYLVWWKNGDHPDDDMWRVYEDTGKKPTEPREGKIVRYFRHPNVDGESLCNVCDRKMNDHGWIDNGKDGDKICPGDYVWIS